MIRQNDEVSDSLVARGAEPITADIMEPQSLNDAFEGTEAVIHLAAFFRSQDGDKIHDINVNGTKNIAQAALKANPGMRFVFASTGLVYANDDALAREDDPVAPTRPYPASKVEAEQYLLQLHTEQGLDLRILRFAFVYGAGDPHLQESGALLERWGWHPAQQLHMVHHADIAQAVKLVVAAGGIDGQTYNVGDSAPVAALEALRLAGQNVKLGDPKAPLKNPWEGLVDTSKIRHLGFRPLLPSVYEARDLGLL
jgi:nucleoside-diphosphate-sugar epimerase